MMDRKAAKQIECPAFDDSSVSANQEAIERIKDWGAEPLPVYPSQPSTAKPGQKPDNKAPRRKGSDERLYRLTKAQQQQPESVWMDGAEGVGYLVPTGMVTVDFDRKHFESDATCKDAIDQFIADNGLGNAYVSETMNGGRHVGPFHSEKLPGYEKFGINNLEHCGELRGPGSFVIESGPGYTQIQSGEIVTISEIKGVHPTKQAESPDINISKLEPVTASEVAKAAGRYLSLDILIRRKSRQLLDGQVESDASEELKIFYQESVRWSHLCLSHGIATDDPKALYLKAAEACGRSQKAEAIINGIDPDKCRSALERAKGIRYCNQRLEKLLTQTNPKIQLETETYTPVPGEDRAELGSPMCEWIKSEKTGKELIKNLPDAIDLLRNIMGESLRFNQLKNRYEINGKPANLERLYLQICYEYGLKISKESGHDIIIAIAEDNSYHPIKNYLDGVHQEYGDSVEILNEISKRYFGSDDPIHSQMLTRWLVGAVARIYNPGCKNDVALFLQGKQGHRKSTFFNTLASDEWFDDSLGSAGDKDQLQKLYRGWIFEWAELESVFRKKDVSETKAFMATKIDIFRPPYAREPKEFKRSSVFCGTTNEHTFLNDPTGDRRYWVIPVTQTIDSSLIEVERDRVWAAAVALYKGGEQWWLTPEEDKQNSEKNKEWRSRDPWEERVLGWAKDEAKANGQGAISTSEILTRAIDIPINKQTPKEQARVAKILTAAGWETSRRKYKGQRQSVYIVPTEKSDEELLDALESVRKSSDYRNLTNPNYCSEEQLNRVWGLLGEAERNRITELVTPNPKQ